MAGMGLRLPAAVVAAGLASLPTAADARTEMVDIALVLSVDVSASVDEERYTLQMEGIAKAFESREVEAAILSGPNHAMFVTLVEWSNQASVSVPWTLVTSAEEARAFAEAVRHAPRGDNDFTCMSRALGFVQYQVLPVLPAPAGRIVIDVSSDGRDNCNLTPALTEMRDRLVASARLTINGLPILEDNEAMTLEAWYRENVIGGPGAFIEPAHGYDDFARAMQRKFVVEVSAR
jgi:hypothetical protein